MLVEHNLFGTINKVGIAIERLKMFEPPEGYYVADSGGKDSTVILDLVKRSGVKFDSHHNLTTVDPPELIHYIKKHHPETTIHRPEKTMWQLIVENGMPPLRQMRYCCRVLKERGGNGRLVVTGVRAQESARRANRKLTETCYNDNSKRFLNVIIDWTEDDVWEYIRTNNIPYCSLYDEGWPRIGCVCCPNGNQLKQAQRWPKIAEQYKRACIKAYNHRIASGKSFKTWRSGEEMFYWWISGQPSGVKEEETEDSLFFET